jgi:hypothetical protein
MNNRDKKTYKLPTYEMKNALTVCRIPVVPTDTEIRACQDGGCV